MTKLVLQHIRKPYGSHVVLQFDHWEIDRGVYWLKGGNGTGKTTLFRVITGQTPFSGTVKLNNIDLRQDPVAFRSQISYAEAEPQYPLFITGKELLDFYCETRKGTQAEAIELAKLFELETFLLQPIGGYSSGMLKKLSLVCAFIGNVDFYILDEPLITIDVASAHKLYELIKTKVAQGKSFLLSSHQQIDPEKLSLDSVFEIRGKQIVAC